jgi:hypothetical protein
MQEGADALGSEDTAVQMKAADAIVARAGASGHPDMGLGYAPVTSPLRLALAVIRFTVLCSARHLWRNPGPALCGRLCRSFWRR